MNIALKEWAATCCALAAGRQILLLRKGGILDADGAFELEHSQFWLLPTYEHQHAQLVKPEARDLLALADAQRVQGENSQFVLLRQWARVERVWNFTRDQENRVRAAQHMWSEDYLQIRWNFRAHEPLLCVAVRTYNPAQPQRIAWSESFGGCRSWIVLPDDASPENSVENSVPALDDVEFANRLRALESVLK